MLRKMTLGLMIMAVSALAACHDGHHPRGNGPGPGGYGQSGGHDGGHDGGHHDDHH